MNTLIFLMLVGAALGVAFLFTTAYGQGLVDDAQQWWRLRSMQVAAAVALVPQFLDVLMAYFGDLLPQVQTIFTQLLPNSTQNALTFVGAVFAFYRLVKQKGLPKFPSLPDDTDDAGA